MNIGKMIRIRIYCICIQTIYMNERLKCSYNNAREAGCRVVLCTPGLASPQVPKTCCVFHNITMSSVYKMQEWAPYSVMETRYRHACAHNL